MKNELTENPALHKYLLGKYAGWYSLGVGYLGDTDGLILQVERNAALNPSLKLGYQTIIFEDELIPLVVKINTPPRSL